MTNKQIIDGIKIIKIIEPRIAKDGLEYYKTPKLDKDEYIAVRLKKSNRFIRPTGGQPYLAKDVMELKIVMNKSTEFVVVRELTNDR
jgi:hypothetical protein